jgi:Flp pilus assembly secretin CpaC
MSCRTVCIATAFLLTAIHGGGGSASGQPASGQSEDIPTLRAKSDKQAPRVSLQIQFVELNVTQNNEAAIRELFAGLKDETDEKMKAGRTHTTTPILSLHPSTELVGLRDELESKQYGRVLSEATLTLENGIPGHYQDGQDFDLKERRAVGNTIKLVSDSNNSALKKASENAGGTLQKFIGTEVDATIRTSTRDRMMLDLKISRGQLDPLPEEAFAGIRVQKVAISFNVLPDQSLLARGFRNQSQLTSVSKTPLLSDLPGVGGAFTSRTSQTIESEVVVLVIPEILTP